MGLFNSVQGVNQTIGAATSVFGAISAANNAVNTIASTAGSFADLGAVDNLRAIGLPTAGEAVGDIMSAIATFPMCPSSGFYLHKPAHLYH